MKNLKELKNGFFQIDGTIVPNDLNNIDYQKIQEYIKNGGEYEKFDYLKEAKNEKIAEIKEINDKKNIEPTINQGYLMNENGSLNELVSFRV